MSLNIEEVNKLRKLYPLHYAVFENNISYLKELLESSENEKINQLDIHGRSPIMLATVLNHIDCAEFLLKHGADANVQNKGIGFFYLSNFRYVVIISRSYQFRKSKLFKRSFKI